MAKRELLNQLPSTSLDSDGEDAFRMQQVASAAGDADGNLGSALNERRSALLVLDKGGFDLNKAAATKGAKPCGQGRQEEAGGGGRGGGG